MSWVLCKARPSPKAGKLAPSCTPPSPDHRQRRAQPAPSDTMTPRRLLLTVDNSDASEAAVVYVMQNL